jgi:hypothetical protein
MQPMALADTDAKLSVRMADVAYVANVRIGRVKGPSSRAWLPAKQDPVAITRADDYGALSVASSFPTEAAYATTTMSSKLHTAASSETGIIKTKPEFPHHPVQVLL